MTSTGGEHLLHTKIVKPTVANLLHRARLCDDIARGLHTNVTVISAPAGYGKTTALVDFANQCPVPVCWYTADERDRDLGTFVSYIIGAIETQFSGFGSLTRAALERSLVDPPQDPTSAVGDLVNEILEISSSFVLVIDNYDAVDTSPGIRMFVHRLLDVFPSNCHLMLTGRTLPDVPLTRLVAKRQVVGLNAQTIRLTSGESRDLLQMSGIEVTQSQAEVIAQRSEGWITGVLLLAGLLHRESGEALLAGEGGIVGAYEYLAGEVLGQQPPDVRHFLCTSAVLREMSSAYCRDILGIKSAPELLAEVDRRNLFVTRFGSGADAVYRYHNLFRAFLREQLLQDDPDRLASLHLNAGEWFERHENIEEAVHHYVMAGAFSAATVLMERVAVERFMRGRGETLVQWGDALPTEVRIEAPRLMLYYSRVLTDQYRYDGALDALRQAEVGFADRGDQVSLAKVRSQRAKLGVLEGHYEQAIEEAQAALEMLDEDEEIERANALHHLGQACVQLGRFDEGVARLNEALGPFRQAGNLYNVVNLLHDLSHAYFGQGRFDEASAALNEALLAARRLGAPTQLAGVLNNLGYFHYTRGEYKQALALYEEGLALSQRAPPMRWEAYIAAGIADIYRDIGNYDRAVPFYDSAWRIARESEPSLAVYILAAQADMYRWQGDCGRALAVLKQARDLAEQANLEFEKNGLLRVSHGIAQAENGKTSEGVRLVADAIDFLSQRHARHELSRALFLLAKAHHLTGAEQDAIEALERAVDLARDIQTDQFIVVEGQCSLDLLNKGVAQGVAGCREIIERSLALPQILEDDLIAAGEEGPPTPLLQIYALGQNRVVQDEHEVSASEWRATAARDLFFYILMNKQVNRGTVGLAFWPDLVPEQVTNRFHVTLHRLRGALGKGSVVAEEQAYRLADVPYSFDVEQFESLVERARLLPQGVQAHHLWQQAVQLYQGDFLPDIPGTWCVPKREELRQKHVEALIGVGKCHEAFREFNAAVEWYERVLGVDNLREDVHCLVMRCYAKAGLRAQALLQYQRCCDILEQELGTHPSTDTTRLYERITEETDLA